MSFWSSTVISTFCPLRNPASYIHLPPKVMVGTVDFNSQRFLVLLQRNNVNRRGLKLGCPFLPSVMFVSNCFSEMFGILQKLNGL